MGRAGVRLVDFERGNEINRDNADFPVPNSGRVLGIDDLNNDNDPEAVLNPFWRPSRRDIAWSGFLLWPPLEKLRNHLLKFRSARARMSFDRNPPDQRHHEACHVRRVPV